MKNLLRLCGFLLLALALTGCAHAPLPANPPTRHTLRLLARSPEQYTIFIDPAHAYHVGYDGLVMFEVPALPPGHATYFLGMKVADHASEDMRVIQVLKGGLPVRRLSLRELYQLPIDSDNSRLLRL